MKSGQEIARENVARLQAWLEAHAATVPYLSNGRVNRSRLAAEAGLDRQTFRNNPLCRTIVEELEGASNKIKTSRDVVPDVQRLIEERDKRISALTALVGKREAELDALRRENQRLRAAAAIDEHMIETFRRFPPPSQ